uniref:Odorant binding protein n=1 Tax=Manduca sexta TaxID=7130 RepID=E2FKZ4_MANSE|nr:odorant binding protein [Manduca sexta]
MIRAVVFCCCMVALMPFSANAMTDEQKEKIHEHFEKLGLGCLKEYTITEDDIKDLRAKKVPSGENAGCFLACMMKEIGVLNDEGMLEKGRAMELAKEVFDDAEELKKIEESMHSCSSVNSESVGDGEKGCERAMLAYKCMVENASKFGFDI